MRKTVTSRPLSQKRDGGIFSKARQFPFFAKLALAFPRILALHFVKDRKRFAPLRAVKLCDIFCLIPVAPFDRRGDKSRAVVGEAGPITLFGTRERLPGIGKTSRDRRGLRVPVILTLWI